MDMKKNKDGYKLDKSIHALNNLLTNVNLSAELLLKGLFGKLNTKQKKYLKVILLDSKKMKNLIKKLK